MQTLPVSTAAAKKEPKLDKNALKIAILISLGIVMLVVIACAVLVWVVYPPKARPQPTPTDIRPSLSYSLVTQDPLAPPTATPFQPIQATPGGAPNNNGQPLQPVDRPNAGGDGASVQTPSPVATSSVNNKDIVKVLFLGSDQRPEGYGFRTDVIMMLIINKKTGNVALLSFPRDLWVYIPGWMNQRINTAMAHGGFDLMCDTLEYNFGIRPDFYVLTNFWSFVDTVDSLGGLDVNVPVALEDQCEPPKTGWCSVPVGMVHMDGETALWYVRSRRTTNDFERGRRGREVVVTLFFKMMSLNAVVRFPELYNIYKGNVETNIKLEDMLPLLPMSVQVAGNPDRIHSYGIGPEQVTPFMTEDGAAVLLPINDAIQQIIHQAMGD